jgi:hypothetical protein
MVIIIPSFSTLELMEDGERSTFRSSEPLKVSPSGRRTKKKRSATTLKSFWGQSTLGQSALIGRS